MVNLMLNSCFYHSFSNTLTHKLNKVLILAIQQPIPVYILSTYYMYCYSKQVSGIT